MRNRLMDFIKALAAIGVVLVHFPFPGVLGKILGSIGVCGVVFFFLVSGYYAYDPDAAAACAKIRKRFIRNLVITLIAVAVYLVFTVIEQLALGTFRAWLTNFKNPWLPLRVLVLGDFEFIHGDPLWFMPALLYSYLTLYLLHRFRIGKYAYILLPLLLLLRIGTEICTNTYGADWHLSGNFLVGGLPIVLLGHYIASKKDVFAGTPLYLTVPFCVFSALLLFVTVNIPVFGLDVSQIFKIWLALEIFLLAIRLPDKAGVPCIGRIGDRYSLYIYLSHFLIGTLLLDILLQTGAPEWIRGWVLPVVVIVLSLLVSVGLYALAAKRKPAKA